MPYHDMRIVSLTGRPWPEFDKALIERAEKIGVLTDKEHTPTAIAQRMLEYGYTNYTIYVGEHLGNPSLEKVTTITLEEAAKTARSKWHELRLCSLLILANKYRHKSTPEPARADIFRIYTRLAQEGFVNNWDLVDLTAPDITGAYAFAHGVDELEVFAASGMLWQERIAVLSMFPFIRAGEQDIPFRMVTRFLGHRHDLMHKAVGWMLREIGKRDREALTAYLNAHKAKMPRTALRYAIEHYPEPERKAFLAR